jgi:hypothetical protein
LLQIQAELIEFVNDSRPRFRHTHHSASDTWREFQGLEGILRRRTERARPKPDALTIVDDAAFFGAVARALN